MGKPNHKGFGAGEKPEGTVCHSQDRNEVCDLDWKGAKGKGKIAKTRNNQPRSILLEGDDKKKKITGDKKSQKRKKNWRGGAKSQS